jgi:hypothetical protein
MGLKNLNENLINKYNLSEGEFDVEEKSFYEVEDELDDNVKVEVKNTEFLKEALKENKFYLPKTEYFENLEGLDDAPLYEASLNEVDVKIPADKLNDPKSVDFKDIARKE